MRTSLTVSAPTGTGFLEEEKSDRDSAPEGEAGLWVHLEAGLWVHLKAGAFILECRCFWGFFAVGKLSPKLTACLARFP